MRRLAVCALFVVIAAGGGGAFGTGDAIVAFALPSSAKDPGAPR